MKFEEIIAKVGPDEYQTLKTAIELGKWPNGNRLDQAQIEYCMQAVIGYETMHNLPEDQRIGFIDRTKKTDCDSKKSDDDDIQPVTLQ